MKRILLRSKTTPFDIFDPITFVQYDKCGTNLGNLLYQHSVYKHLSTSDQELTINHNSVNLKKVDHINSNYDHFVVPLANAFRPSFAKNLVKLTEFLKKIEIPITVVGVGAQTDFSGNFDNLSSISPIVKEFLSVVLDKSNSIGVRGEITQKYIESLGFVDKAKVIGCPSLFTYPENILNIQKKIENINLESKLGLNLSATGKQAAFSNHLGNFADTFTFNINKYSNSCYIPQETRSLEYLIYGVNKRGGFEHAMVDEYTSKFMFDNNKVKFFLNSYSWFEYLKNCDFTFGTRLHGCIASLIAGTPAMLFAHDSRTLEIADYFKLPYLNLNQIDKVLDAKEIYKLVDLNPLKEQYSTNLKNYADFLRSHGLQTIVDNEAEMQAFDTQISNMHKHLFVEALTNEKESIGERLYWLKQNNDFNLLKK